MAKTRKKTTRKKSTGRRAAKRASTPRGPGRLPAKIEITRAPAYYSAAGYHAATVARREGRTASGGSGDSHLQQNRSALINISRQLYRDNPIYNGIIDRFVTYVIGTGFTLQMRTKSKAFNDRVEKLWKEDWKRPEVRGLLSGHQVEKMLARECALVGDTGFIKIKDGSVQHIEAEQIDGGRSVADGIKKNAAGKPLKYFVSSYVKGRVQKEKATELDPENFLFVTDPTRPSATRTAPPCQSAFAMLHRINDVCDSEAIAWQLLARLAVVINRENAGMIGQAESTADPAATGDELAQRLTEIGYALIFHANPGEEIKSIDRDIPGMNFTQSITTFLRLLGLPLGMPLEIIMLDWTKSNYSQLKAILEQAFNIFQGWQRLFADRFYSPRIEWKIKRWIDEKKINDRKDLKWDWTKPTFPWIEQLKEAQAQGAKVDRGFTTHTAVCKSLNTEREDVVGIREMEVRDAIERAKKIESDTGEKVSWQIFAGLKAPGTETGRPGGSAPAPGAEGKPPGESEGDEKDET